jgi:hypothetical protein
MPIEDLKHLHAALTEVIEAAQRATSPIAGAASPRRVVWTLSHPLLENPLRRGTALSLAVRVGKGQDVDHEP